MKKNQGGAYLTVVIASLLLIAFGITILTVTATSRNITAHYENYLSLYDLAVSGNEQAFFIIEAAYLQNNDAADIHTGLIQYFDYTLFDYHRTWRLEIGIADDVYQAATVVKTRGDGGFIVETEIYKINDGVSSIITLVRADINILDYNTVEMVELHRIAD